MKLNTASGLVQLVGILGVPVLLFHFQQGPPIWDTWFTWFEVGFSCDWFQLPSPISLESHFSWYRFASRKDEIL